MRIGRDAADRRPSRRHRRDRLHTRRQRLRVRYARGVSSLLRPTWGRHKNRTRPTPGNHEYLSPGASPYFEYFGASAGLPGRGFYSFSLGDRRAFALNSNIAAGRRSAQAQWLRAELAASRTTCTIAYWHHPVFSSGPHGGTPVMQEIWRTLYEFDADVIMAGHEHLYERFALLDPDGTLDPVRGIRQFVVGTGGAPLYGFTTVHPHSEARDSSHGVLTLTLSANTYQWEFITAQGLSDIGTGRCH